MSAKATLPTHVESAEQWSFALSLGGRWLRRWESKKTASGQPHALVCCCPKTLVPTRRCFVSTWQLAASLQAESALIRAGQHNAREDTPRVPYSGHSRALTKALPGGLVHIGQYGWGGRVAPKLNKTLL
jgi:hypothetical protein